jgi:hypothetical protein
MITVEETMAAIKMVLDAAGDADDNTPDKEICSAIDWSWLERLENRYKEQKHNIATSGGE